MLKFNLLLWVLTKRLQSAVKHNPQCADYIQGKDLIFQIQAEDVKGRYFKVQNGEIKSHMGLTADPRFTLRFKTAHRGFAVLSAKDGVDSFLNALRTQELVITGSFVDVVWFQNLVNFIQPKPKK